MLDMECQSLGLRDGTLVYRVYGQGPDVLLLHGWVSSGRMWQGVMEALGSHFTLWAPDLPGFGDSPLADRTRVPQLDDYVEQIAAFCEALNVQPVAVIGHSLGALLALLLAIEAPDLMQRLVLLAPLVTGRLGLNMDRVLSSPPGRAALQAMRGLWRVPVLMWGASVFGFRPRRVISKAAWRKVQDIQKAPWSSTYGGVKAVLEHDVSVRLGEIRVPTLVIVGEDDLTIPPSEGRLAAALISEARLEVLPDVAHQLTDEAPDIVNQLMFEFLME